MTWSLVTCRSDGAEMLAVRRADGTVVAPPELKQWPSMLDLLDDWTAAEPVVRALEVDSAPVLEIEAVLAPVRYPRKVLCAGVNYKRHLLEMGIDLPGEGWRPFFFLKPPTTTVIGAYDPIPARREQVRRYDWEAELAVVIGVGGTDIAPEHALDHVAAYTVANDVTARGLHKRDVVPGAPFLFDWVASKAIDGSLPLGPGLTPAFFVPDPQALQLRLWVNGELQQDESTGDMLCPVTALIAEASAVMTLEPGDVIITGTPSGVGAAQNRFLHDGDVVRVEIDGLGHLENTVRSASTSHDGNGATS